jgi:Family of unknown function (DUF5995)
VRSFGRLLVAVLAALVVGAAAAAAAQAPPSWTALLPPAAPGGSDPSQAPECPDGKRVCITQVAEALATHVGELRCSHNAVFALAYQRITERIGAAVDDDGFADRRYIAHFDAAFAGEYGRQWDAWAYGSGRLAPAWRVAFSVAQARTARGAGNLLLALNAHIGRDMPLVLERVGLVAAESGSRKPDQDRVNAVLEAAMRPMLTELADTYDPAIDDGDVPGGLDESGLYQWVAALRERAWRRAEQLDAADGDPVAKAALVARTEREAQLGALALAAATAYPPASPEPAARDAYCVARASSP